MKIAQRTNLLATVLLIALGFLIYSNTFQGVFHFDDFAYIVNNVNIRDLSAMDKIWRAASLPTRFISFLSFAVNYHFHGLDVFGYHLVNILIHILNACLVLWLVQLLRQPFSVALFASLLFLTHPLQTEAVSYIVQRFTSLATLFYLLTVCSYLKYRQHNDQRWLVVGLFSAIIAMLTKQIAFTIPIIILFLEVFFYQKKRIKLSWKWIVPFILLLLVIPFLMQFNFSSVFGREVISRSHTGDPINVWTYSLTQLRVIWRYVWLFLVPLGQTLDYDFHVSRSLLDWKVLTSIAALCSVFYIMIKKYTSHRIVVFGLLWFFVTISITTSIVPIPQVIFEHRCYLPSVGIFLLVSWVAATLIRSKIYFGVIVIIMTCTLSFLTHQRNAVWQSDVTLWEDIVRKAPLKVRGYNNLGIAYFTAQRYADAIDQFDRVIAMNPNAARAYNNRGLAYTALGENEAALESYHQAIDVYTHSQDPLTKKMSTKKVWSEMFNNRANLYKLKGRVQEAEADYHKAIVINPQNERAYYNLGRIHEERLEFVKAYTNYQKAVKLDPRYDEAHQALGIIYHANGQYTQAIESFSRAIALKPTTPMSYYYRCLSYYQSKNLQSAKVDLLQSIQLGYEPSDKRLEGVFRKYWEISGKIAALLL